jgi:hypothetical protein
LENLYSSKPKISEERVKIQDVFNQLKLNQEYTNHLNIAIMSNEIEVVVKDKQCPENDEFKTEFYHTFKNEQYQYSSNFSRKQKGKNNLFTQLIL